MLRDKYRFYSIWRFITHINTICVIGYMLTSKTKISPKILNIATHGYF